ncbi:hypothetical protein PybrP1_005085 [[Pythium] brassicae (nom. inval.)]|nr:hypothetical protein PybrP1_005085 [[Pythium] brassicae (nom. inval.)]
MKTPSALLLASFLLLLLLGLATHHAPAASRANLHARMLVASQDAHQNRHASVWEPTLDALVNPSKVFRMLVSTPDVVWIPNFASHQGASYYNYSQLSSYTANGTEFDDGQMTLGAFAIPHQGFAEVSNFTVGGALIGWDGMLGLGSESHEPDCPSKLPFHSLVASGVLDEPLFAIYVNPLTRNGALTIGATDTSRYTGEIVYADVVDPSMWMVAIGDIQVNGRSMTQLHRAEIAPEIGFLFGPEDEVGALAKAVGASPMKDGYFRIDCSTPGPDIEIVIAGARFVLTKSDYALRGGPTGDEREEECTLAFLGFAYDRWTFGLPFMQKVYTVFNWGDPQHDGRGRKVGFAVGN